MIENLSYIYLAMYALDLYHSITAVLDFVFVGIPIAAIIGLGITALVSNSSTEFVKYFKNVKIIYIIALVLFIISLPIKVAMPTENTIKAYMGVKAVQSVATYLEANTDIPERSKATITKLWDRVDSYLTTIDIDKTVSDAVKNKSAVNLETTGIADSTLTKIKQQVRDSIINSLNK